MRASKVRFPVLKTYFKVIKANIPMLAIYTVIFLTIAVLIVKPGADSNSVDFQETKTDIAFFDYDNTALTQGLKESLEQNANFIDVADDKGALQDALFFQDVRYIVRIPKGFTEKFLNGEDATIEKTSGQSMTNCVNINLAINRYLSVARLYGKNMPGISDEQLAKYVKDTLAQKAEVTTNNYNAGKADLSYAASFFNYLAYIVMMLMLLGVSSIMMVFNRPDLQNRNRVSPVKQIKINSQLLIGHFAYMLIVWVLSIALDLIFYGTDIVGFNFMLLCLNLLCICIASLGLSSFIGMFVKDTGVQSGVSNVVGLGLAFISGVFVPQGLLSSSLLTVAHFTPTYWYVKAVYDIASLSSSSFASVMPIIENMLIQLIFAVVFFAAAIIVTSVLRTRRKNTW